MITLFEKFNQISTDFNKYLKKTKQGRLLIPDVSFDELDEKFLLNPEKESYARYYSLMKFFLYLKLLNYNGRNPLILKYVQGIKSKDPKSIEMINKIPNSIHVFNMVNENFKLNYSSRSYDGDRLQIFINNWELILSDRFLSEYISMVYEASKNAAKSERIVKGVITMMYSKFYDVVYANISEDLGGVDLWKINRKSGERQSIQVKNIAGKINVKDNTIYLNNTSIDLHDYKSWADGKLKYDYIGFYTQKEQKIYFIKSNAIFTIDKYEKERYIKIKLKNWVSNPTFASAFKIIDVPKKFIGKDYSQIFYTPEIEGEIQQKNPDIFDDFSEPNLKNRNIFY